MLLNISNIRLFNSLNLSMTLISNGGFLPSNSLDLIIKTFFSENYFINFFTFFSYKYFYFVKCI